MPVVPNLHYDNPQFGQWAKDLGTVVFGNPDASAERDLRVAQAWQAQSLGDKAQNEAARGAASLKAAQGYGNAFASLAATPEDVDFASYQRRVGPALGTIALAAGGNADQVADMTRKLWAARLITSATRPEKFAGNQMLGTATTDNFAADPGMVTEAQQADFKKTKYTADTKADADRYGARQQAGATVEAARIGHPKGRLDVDPEHDVYLTEDDPLYAKYGPVIHGQKRAAADKQPIAITDDVAKAIEFDMARGYPGAVQEPQGKKPGFIHPSFWLTIPADKRQAAKIASQKAYQEGRTIGEAAAAGQRALGFKLGTPFKPQTTWWKGDVKENQPGTMGDEKTTMQLPGSSGAKTEASDAQPGFNRAAFDKAVAESAAAPAPQAAPAAAEPAPQVSLAPMTSDAVTPSPLTALFNLTPDSSATLAPPPQAHTLDPNAAPVASVIPPPPGPIVPPVASPVVQVFKPTTTNDTPTERVTARPFNYPPGAADMLRRNPNLAGAFDAKYGPGAAHRVLGGR
jgi:hypothetical protein